MGEICVTLKFIHYKGEVYINKNNLRIVSLFDGISCGYVALERAGFTVSYYAAFKIDKYAKSISNYNYPNILQFGDVLNTNYMQFKNIDLVLGGSPCRFWGIAKTNREVDKTGMGWRLFIRFVEAIKKIQPRFWLYENVASMPKSIKSYISEELDVEPMMINSSLVSAQQRKRLYWTNITNVTQPNDCGILLRDILESGIAYQDKSHCVTSTYNGAVFWNSLKRSQRSMVVEPVGITDNTQKIHKQKALSMVKRQKKGLFVAQDIEEVGAALRTRIDEKGKFKRLEVRKDGKTNALTTVLTDSVVCSPVRLGSIGKGGQGHRIYSVKGKTVCISANGGGRGGNTGLYKIDLPDGDYTVRKLTPVEAERCQGLDDGYTSFGINDNGKLVNISNTQRYKVIGNGWQIDTVAHILSFLH